LDDDERPTAKREAVDPVDIANARNQTQALDRREILASLGEPLPPYREGTSGTRAAVTSDAIERFAVERGNKPVAEEPAAMFERPTVEMHAFEAIEPPSVEAVAPSVELFCVDVDEEAEAASSPQPRFFTRHEGRLLLTPTALVVAVALALLVGLFVGRLHLL